MRAKSLNKCSAQSTCSTFFFSVAEQHIKAGCSFTNSITQCHFRDWIVPCVLASIKVDFFTRSCCASSIIFIIGVAVSNFKRARTPSPELPNKMAPVKDLIEQSIKDNLVMVFSKSTCPFCKKVGYLLSAFNHSIFSKNKG